MSRPPGEQPKRAETPEPLKVPEPPQQTKDDTDVGWGETPDPQAARDEHERWLLEQRPPHWD